MRNTYTTYEACIHACIDAYSHMYKHAHLGALRGTQASHRLNFAFIPDMGGCRNYGPFLGTLNIRGRTIIGIQEGTIILTTTHIVAHTVSRKV